MGIKDHKDIAKRYLFKVNKLTFQDKDGELGFLLRRTDKPDFFVDTFIFG